MSQVNSPAGMISCTWTETQEKGGVGFCEQGARPDATCVGAQLLLVN